MFSLIARYMMAAFERRWNYDMSYAREILDGGGFGATAPLQALGKISAYRRNVPPSVYHAARITAAIAGDCGPCAQLFVAMAEADGIDATTLQGLISGDLDALGADARLGASFARAVLARDDAQTLRAEILERWGMRALASLAYGIVAAQAYPTLKSALGHATVCIRLRAGGEELTVGKQRAHVPR